MKRTVIISILATTLLNAAYIKPTKVEIYQNGSFLTKEVIKNADETDIQIQTTVSFNISLNDIDIKEAKGCKVEDVLLKESKNYSDELQNQIEALEAKLISTKNRIESLKQNNKLLQTLSLEKLKTTAKNIIEISNFQSKKYFANLNEISKLQKESNDISKKLAELRKKRAFKSYKTLFVDLACEQNSDLKAASIKYPFALKRRLSYNIYANTKDKTLTIENRIVLSQSSGEDLKDIELIYASYPKISQIAPPNFYPWYIGVNRRDKVMLQKRAEESIQPAPAPMAANMSVSYGKTAANEFYDIKHITLNSGKTQRVKLSDDKYRAKFLVQIDGYATSHPFIAFKFDSKKFYNPSNARFYLDNSFVGNRYFSLRKKKDQKLYFGEDLNIKVKKKLLKDFNEEPIFSSNKIKTTKIWSYDITNNHPFDIKVDLIEKTPVSKSEEVQIESIAKPKYDKMEKNGKTIWHLSLKSGDHKNIEFGYSIKKPK